MYNIQTKTIYKYIMQFNYKLKYPFPSNHLEDAEAKKILNDIDMSFTHTYICIKNIFVYMCW